MGFVLTVSWAITLLPAFHHEGVADHFGEADEVMQAELEEEWLGPASELPPFVPCSDLKPRITTNLSYGIDPVNGGVPKAGRSVTLPSIQAPHAAAVRTPVTCT